MHGSTTPTNKSTIINDREKEIGNKTNQRSNNEIEASTDIETKRVLHDRVESYFYATILRGASISSSFSERHFRKLSLAITERESEKVMIVNHRENRVRESERERENSVRESERENYDCEITNTLRVRLFIQQKLKSLQNWLTGLNLVTEAFITNQF